MLSIVETIERTYPFGNVIVACSSHEHSEKLVEMLSDRGLNPVAVAESASVAMALAAQVRADVAIVDPELHGGGRALTMQLQDTWGVPSLFLKRA